ncbi:hypothetical protein [Pengzhenrongella frigida]|uniref:Uncharacterized protein n=1 Tax=Pengzhenrongella frigida TaxID=1259133 RepID=A0A4Q5N1X8_9MICO|nr:hypothetical protein [Cellulomonas sp. HLT2-17]RYV50031.1 hypothetical protein EUA98_15810 [Cellulomonas sp. HLT2-17]
MALTITTNAAARTAYRNVAPAQPDPATQASTSVSRTPVPVSRAPHPDATGTRQSGGGPIDRAAMPITDTISFTSHQVPDGASGPVPIGAGAGKTGSISVATAGRGTGAGGSAVVSAGASGVLAQPEPERAPAVIEPKGIITVGRKTLDLTTVEYLPTDGPAARAGKLRAAIAAVFGSAVASAAVAGEAVDVDPKALIAAPTSATAATSTDLDLNAVQGATTPVDPNAVQDAAARLDPNAVQDGSESGADLAVAGTSARLSPIRDHSTAAGQVRVTAADIVAQAGAAMLAQAASISPSVAQLLY